MSEWSELPSDCWWLISYIFVFSEKMNKTENRILELEQKVAELEAKANQGMFGKFRQDFFKKIFHIDPLHMARDSRDKLLLAHTVNLFITVRKRCCGKVMFLHLSVSHSVHRGVCPSACCYTPPRQTPPGQTPPRQTPPGRHPQQTATAADSTHPTGMHSCEFIKFIPVSSLALIGNMANQSSTLIVESIYIFITTTTTRLTTKPIRLLLRGIFRSFLVMYLNYFSSLLVPRATDVTGEKLQ